MNPRWLRTVRSICTLFFGVILVSAVLSGADQPHSDLSRVVRPLIDAHRGRVAVAVKHLETGDRFAADAEQVMPTASLIKLPVMVTAYHQAARGELDLGRMLTLKKEDKVPGSGILTGHFSAGTQVSLRDAIHLMIVYSDNTATNLVIDQVGIARVNEHMAALGLSETRLNSKVFRRDTSVDRERSEKYGLGSTTADEVLRLLEMLHAGKLGDEAATKEMTAHLLACNEGDKLKRFLPPGTKIAHKSGSVSAARCEAGIIYAGSGPVAVCVLTAENEDQSWRSDNAGNRLCADIGLAVYNHFSPSGGTRDESFPNVLAQGAFGDSVETLQRTLNARLDPPPGLSVDGDFGPQTERAVKRFQRQSGFDPNGRVGPETWQKLEPLVTDDPPVPEPQVVNTRALPRESADPLDGPPFVTCKAWAIADGRTGKVLWGDEADEPLSCASTTKIMTGYLICRLAADNPAVLEETVVFSMRADRTNGSTAGVRAGEKVKVGELLYGLMLPSGNDASVALAEHFGGRVGPPHAREKPGDEASGGGSAADSSTDKDAQERYEAFLGAMNHMAQELCLKETCFKNPHGMTADGHVTTCRDLLTLAHAAMEVDLFRKIVSRREYGVTVTGASGYRRNLLWKNTNRLLPIQGYMGIKTGTTEAAGACLVSAAKRGERSLLLCVLGSTSGDARYVDSRNLYRWAWRKLGEPGE
jgi:serine-type D-Ala-D-Ala carboxypeptidase (penicillin-binding protein 5/6)